jgi:hypothetical protein
MTDALVRWSMNQHDDVGVQILIARRTPIVVRSEYELGFTLSWNVESRRELLSNSASLLVPVIEGKLPSRVRCDIVDIDRIDKFNLDMFLRALKRQVERSQEASTQAG